MITGSPSLRVLDVSKNPIRDDGISLCLQHINTLTELKVDKCGLSVEGNYVATCVITSCYEILSVTENKNCWTYCCDYTNL